MNRNDDPAGWGGWLSGACTEQPVEPAALMEFVANATIGELAAIGQRIIDVLDAAPFDCEAYGAEGAAHGALCFVAGEVGARVCANFRQCAATMRAARQQLFDRIQQRAATGDPIGVALAEQFTRPEQLLGGDDAAS
jgi:hypothetical protein